MAETSKKVKELEEHISVLEKELEKQNKQSFETPPDGTIVLIRQSDGNWKGFTTKNRQIITERQYDPQIVLQLLLVRG